MGLPKAPERLPHTLWVWGSSLLLAASLLVLLASWTTQGAVLREQPQLLWLLWAASGLSFLLQPKETKENS